jgi:hypothetical protein
MAPRPFVVGSLLGIAACGGWWAYAMHCYMPHILEPLHGLSGAALEEAMERNYARELRWRDEHRICLFRYQARR